MMKSLKETLMLDNGSVLAHFSSRLIELLKDFLEQADNERLFLAVLDTIVIFSRAYPKSFNQHFNDIVDICIGWHLEPEQKPELRQECSKSLQELAPFFRTDLSFTKSLLGQFIEDIESCKTESGSFIYIFNTVIKCLYPVESLVHCLGVEFVQESFFQVLLIARSSIVSDNEMIMPLNEFLQIILDLFQLTNSLENVKIVEEMLTEEVKIMKNFSDTAVLGLLQAINSYILTVKNDVPLSMVDCLLNGNSSLMGLKFKIDQRFQGPLVEIFQCILDIKNVSILQQAYKHLLIDFQCCFNAMGGKF